MFCKTVWNGLHILPDGYIRLCSIGQNTDKNLDMQRARDKDGNVMHILTHSIQEIMNSDKHKEVRLFNVNNPDKWSPHCDCCENREIITKFDRNHKNKSRRVYLMGIEDNDVVSELDYTQHKIDSEGNIDWMPSSLDIRFGNLCNQKCVMCNPTFSNLWYEEYFDYFKTNSFGQGTKITVTKDINTGKWLEPSELSWFEDPRWWPKFEEMMPHLRHIYITGGEPMVTPAHDINDYNLGIKYKLPVIDTLNEDGTMSEAAQLYIGEDRFVVRKKILADLEAKGHIEKLEDYKSPVGHSERTDAIIEPRLSMQWWCNMTEMAKPALDAVMNDDIKFYPPKFKNTYKHWM
jgi:hypothetical protein